MILLSKIKLLTFDRESLTEQVSQPTKASHSALFIIPILHMLFGSQSARSDYLGLRAVF